MSKMTLLEIAQEVQRILSEAPGDLQEFRFGEVEVEEGRDDKARIEFHSKRPGGGGLFVLTLEEP